jgi:hypothetical protein
VKQTYAKAYSYTSTESAKRAEKLGEDIVVGCTQQGLPGVSCKVDDYGYFGIFFKFESDEVQVITIENHRTSRFNPSDVAPISIRYRTVYKFGGRFKPICTGLTLSKTLPSVSTIVNNLKMRYAKISANHMSYLIRSLGDRTFKLESSSLKNEFFRLKSYIGGEVDEGHSIRFEHLSLEKARQILQILDKHLPVNFEFSTVPVEVGVES